jgi:hypothetical protein
MMRQREHVPCGPGATLIELHRLAIGMGDGCGKGRDLLVSRPLPLDGSRRVRTAIRSRRSALLQWVACGGRSRPELPGTDLGRRYSARAQSAWRAPWQPWGVAKDFPRAPSCDESAWQFLAIWGDPQPRCTSARDHELPRSRARVNPRTCGEHAGTHRFQSLPGVCAHRDKTRPSLTCLQHVPLVVPAARPLNFPTLRDH